MKKISKLITLSLTPVVVLSTIACQSENNHNTQSNKTKELIEEYKKLAASVLSYKQTHFPLYAQYNNGNYTQELFLEHKTKINSFFNELTKYTQDLVNKIKALKSQSWQLNIDKSDPAINNPDVKLFKFWFPSGLEVNALGLKAFGNSKIIIDDAKTQIKDKVPTILNEHSNNINRLNYLLEFFANLGENEEISDLELQENIRLAYNFLKEYLFDKSEDNSTYNILGKDHDSQLSQHTHSHAMINITITAVIENIDLFKNHLKKLVDYYSDYKEDNKFTFIKNIGAREKINNLIQTEIVAKYNQMLQIIEAAEQEITIMRNDFLSLIYPHLEKMIQILGLKVDETLI
ncbi:Uncharacterised protein [Mycoplasmopsis californica]|uniref:Lipoprotein n=1 Tax=Mycoplasmopsis equigenitalium TaxID=114883 RepID=A0ABY5J1D2_9BACT|nr:hypothetical protein [Mycoplasmopsis equigenitalium]UUD36795.1 hypothetical protein NPA09_02760 [Mycoplasmopsis equigenitalium]VEU69907.1 Uncharacterised protein [Mycoplasmopsis californica]